jgi:hypothetical protein
LIIESEIFAGKIFGPTLVALLFYMQAGSILAQMLEDIIVVFQFHKLKTISIGQL